ncbi:tetratricopeptide repeat protein [uncultured Roseobacter sp.]|uniref:tetratricopeptide repeat protein n=1 Tax=uncultured Roseobacter sp. TaxID=114847 RepID=UPI002606373B|nr:tetratricopeptide repeat protein [uncultured Roseobacter sp.]
MKTLCVILFLAAGGAGATCPAPQDTSEEIGALFEEARAAENDQAGQQIAAKMWQVWLRAPNETAQEVLDRGMRYRSGFDFASALREFDRLAEYCPLYAEGFNQRAFVHFLREDYESALVDLDAALALSPDHVGARSGKALTLMNMGRIPEARAELILALENNPWLSERFLLNNGGPLALPGKDI